MIFSDGTGQRGGVYFDETERTSTSSSARRGSAPTHASIPRSKSPFTTLASAPSQPTAQAASRVYRTAYNFVSQGDRSRHHAEHHRLLRGHRSTLAARRQDLPVRLQPRRIHRSRRGPRALPVWNSDQGKNSSPLKRDPASTFKIATEAVKTSTNTSVRAETNSSSINARNWAERFQEKYQCGRHPEFGDSVLRRRILDTVAALSNRGSLMLLAGLSAPSLPSPARRLRTSAQPEYGFGYWLGWFFFDVFVATGFAYVYTHLKFALGLKRSHWWETVHLTTLRQEVLRRTPRHQNLLRKTRDLDRRTPRRFRPRQMEQPKGRVDLERGDRPFPADLVRRQPRRHRWRLPGK